MNRTEHLLSCAAEECNEIAQRVSKALRFGLDEAQVGQELSNADRIVQEFRDLQAVMELLEDCDAIKRCVWIRDVNAIEEKKAKVEKYLRYAESTCGTLKEN